MARLGDLQGQERPMRGAHAAALRGATPRTVATVGLSRHALREDGTLAPITPGGAWDQPAWEVEMLCIMHQAAIKRRNIELERKTPKGGRR